MGPTTCPYAITPQNHGTVNMFIFDLDKTTSPRASTVHPMVSMDKQQGQWVEQ